MLMLSKISIFYELIACSGTLRLHSHPDYEVEISHSAVKVEISSSSYQGLSRRSQIRKSSRELKSISRQGFAFASMEGNCCWKIREKRNGRGNHKYLTPDHHFYEPGWTIRSFEVLDSCKRNK